MPGFWKSITACRESLAEEGFAVMRSFAPGLSSLETAVHLGVIDAVEGLNSTQTLVPLNVDEAPPNTYSGNFGCAEFPLHTDLAHWLRHLTIFYCVVFAELTMSPRDCSMGGVLLHLSARTFCGWR
jgi:hypothetical protein